MKSLVSKESMMPCRLGRETRKLGIKKVDRVKFPPGRDCEADVSSVSPSSKPYHPVVKLCAAQLSRVDGFEWYSSRDFSTLLLKVQRRAIMMLPVLKRLGFHNIPSIIIIIFRKIPQSGELITKFVCLSTKIFCIAAVVFFLNYEISSMSS